MLKILHILQNISKVGWLAGLVFDGCMQQMFCRLLWINISIKTFQCLCFCIYLSVCGELCIISFLAQSDPRECKYVSDPPKFGSRRLARNCQSLLGFVHHIKKFNSFIVLLLNRSGPLFITLVNIYNSSTENSLNLMLANLVLNSALKLHSAPALIYLFFLTDSVYMPAYFHFLLFSKLCLFFF